MNLHLQNVLNSIERDKSLSAGEKEAILKCLNDADKELQLTALKLDRTEKVKRTTAILLEETLEELEKKRKDIEAQNKELEIEAAVERVRATAMRMKQPADMLDVCRTISQQLNLLNIREIRNVQTAIFNQQKGIYLNYEFFRLHDKTTITEVEYNLQPDIKVFVTQMLTDAEAFFTTSFEGAKLKEWLEYQQKSNQFVDPHLYEVNSLHYYFYSIGPGALGISTYTPLNDHELAVFKRFRNVFELAYRRFIDIEQAHAQAREAKIEASLERVRASAMAMHRSDELSDVLSVLFEQFDVLAISPLYTFLSLIDLDKDLVTYRQTGKGGAKVLSEIQFPLDSMAEWKDKVTRMKESTIDSVTCTHYPVETLPKVWEVFGEIFDALPEGSKISPQDFPNGIFTVLGYCKYGFIGYDHNREWDEEDKSIVQRFATEFGRLYQRFLDLQIVEAQTREALIELALERVRGRTMAMQRSEELADVAEVLFKQVRSLEIHAWSTGFNIWQEGNDAYIDWVTNPGGGFMEPYTVDLTTHPFFREIRDAKKRGEDFQVFEISGEPLAETYALLKSFAPKQFEGILASGISFPTRQINHYVFGAQVSLMFITPQPYPEAHDIFKRFGKVFEQTYTRFLDLQKAEAQARESQIQLALERVRARTMAMQRSEELAEVATVLFQQVKALGVPQWTCGFSIFEIDDEEFTWYPGAPGGEILPPSKIPLREHPVFIQFNESRKRGDELYVYEKTGELQADHYRYMLSLPGVGDYLQSRLDAGSELPAFQIDHLANFSHGNLICITYEHVPEMHDIFKRFAKSFRSNLYPRPRSAKSRSTGKRSTDRSCIGEN